MNDLLPATAIRLDTYGRVCPEDADNHWLRGRFVRLSWYMSEDKRHHRRDFLAIYVDRHLVWCKGYKGSQLHVPSDQMRQWRAYFRMPMYSFKPLLPPVLFTLQEPASKA